jgi:hypothetical protein
MCINDTSISFLISKICTRIKTTATQIGGGSKKEPISQRGKFLYHQKHKFSHREFPKKNPQKHKHNSQTIFPLQSRQPNNISELTKPSNQFTNPTPSKIIISESHTPNQQHHNNHEQIRNRKTKKR